MNGLRLFFAAFGIMFLILGNMGFAKGEVEVYISPGNKTVYVNSAFTLDVVINSNGVNHSGAQANINFSAEHATINEVIRGNLYKNGSGFYTFPNSGQISPVNPNKWEKTFEAVIGKHEVSGPGVFVRINATAKDLPGTISFDLEDVKISDPNGEKISFRIINNGTVTILPTPTPTLTFTPSPTATPDPTQQLVCIYGDIDANGAIEAADADEFLFKLMIGEIDTNNPNYDFDSSGSVNEADADVIIQVANGIISC